MRVGLDTSPLVQTQAGTARYVRGLLAHNEYEQLAFHGHGRLATVVRRAGWTSSTARPSAALHGATSPW